MRSRFLLQIGLVVAALLTGVVIVWSRASEEVKPSQSFNMLAYLDERVGTQEDEKDVRCWSSFNKLQMFITQCEITEDAKIARIEQHMLLIQSLWKAAGAKQQAGDYISAKAVRAVMTERFPHVDTDEGIKFDLGENNPVLVAADAIRDYSDTIEPWRLFQTWAARKLDEKGKLILSRQFDQKALFTGRWIISSTTRKLVLVTLSRSH